MKGVFLSLLFLSLLLFVRAQLHGVCCDDDDADRHWHIAIPSDSYTECHFSYMADAEAILPDYHGWGWEINSCDSVSTLCSPTDCDDADGNDNDDDGGGTNSPLDDYDDVVTGPTGCTHLRVVRTWYSDSTCSSGLLDSDQIIRLIDTTSPYLAGPSSMTLECYPGIGADIDELGGYPTTFDSCEPDMEITLTTVGPTGTTCAGQTYTRTFETDDTAAVDCATNTVTLTQVVTVQDTRPPVVIGSLEYHVECDSIPSTTATQPAATDGCNSVAPIAAPTTRVLAGECATEYTELREYIIADSCGNAAVHTVIVHVEDNEAPVIQTTGGVNAGPSSVVRNTDGCPPVFDNYQAVDACASSGVVFSQDITIIRNEENRYSYVAQQEVSATDPCGNTDKRTYQVIVKGTPSVALGLDGPAGTVAKGATFNVQVSFTITNGCASLQNSFILAVDVGGAELQTGAPVGCVQQASGVVYCENLGTGSINLPLSVPTTFLPNFLVIRAVSEYETSGTVLPAADDRTTLVRFA